MAIFTESFLDIIISIGKIPPNHFSTFFKSMYRPLFGCKSDSKELPVETYKVPVDNIKVRKIDAYAICLGFSLTTLETFFKNIIRVLSLL